MDTEKIGSFLAGLRKERNLTQDELGDRIGVTNKTVSRWENGDYLPPVEMLQILSNFYEVSINEILSGERLDTDAYKEKAEANIITALNNSAVSFPEKAYFYKKKWLKAHWVELLLEFIALLAIGICGFVLEIYREIYQLFMFLAFSLSWWWNSRIDKYIYKNFYEDKIKELAISMGEIAN